MVRCEKRWDRWPFGQGTADKYRKNSGEKSAVMDVRSLIGSSRTESTKNFTPKKCPFFPLPDDTIKPKFR
jgi:hypothetical protein